ncbi:MAG TPA: hypothetical protein VMH48_08690 [Methylomirabilota bacterium]|nr:hypothetical protein [Methylomirabilota bacterium]
MDWPNGESPTQPVPPAALPPFPRIWVGYVLGIATFIAEIVAASLHPELLKEPFSVPPLYLFLPGFICLVYWMVCAYEFHLILKQATSGAHAISPLRAAWFHLIPVFSLYWVFKWPRELARFVNGRLPVPLMHPGRTGLAVFIAFVIFLFLDRGFGMILLFWAASRLSRCLRFALEAPPASPPSPLPFS